MRARLREDLTAALKARALTDREMRAIVQTEVDQRAEAAEEYARLGRAEEGATLRREADVLRAHLR